MKSRSGEGDRFLRVYWNFYSETDRASWDWEEWRLGQWSLTSAGGQNRGPARSPIRARLGWARKAFDRAMLVPVLLGRRRHGSCLQTVNNDRWDSHYWTESLSKDCSTNSRLFLLSLVLGRLPSTDSSTRPLFMVGSSF